MDNKLFITHSLFPGKIMMVLGHSQGLCPEMFQDRGMNKLMIGRRVFSHQLHSGPVFLTSF